MTVSTPGGDNEDGAGGVTEAGAHVLSELKSALDLFQPHLCVLVLRHPAVNFASLHSKVGSCFPYEHTRVHEMWTLKIVLSGTYQH